MTKMYMKLLLSFFAVLLITEILVFYLFMVIPVRHFNARFEKFAEQRVMALKEIVEEKVRSEPAVAWSENDSLKRFVSDFAMLLGARIWLTDTDGTMAVASFSGSVQDFPKGFRKGRSHKYFSFALRGHRDFDFYATVPISAPRGQAGDMHILFDRQIFSPRQSHFALGLAIVGIIIALSIIPVSRLITRRIKELQQSAMRIEAGDLSHRAVIKGRDEISELALAFNGMTDRLESMIMSGKELAANVSHELRTPLARIRIAEELLREQARQGIREEWEGNLDAIREDIGELDHLIGRMLELSRLDARESPLKPEPFDPSKLIIEVIGKLSTVIDRKELEMTTELSYDPPFLADREALRSALMNVIGNATKFSSEGGAIWVRMGWQHAALEISVANTFERLAEEDLSRIFDPFHRVARSPATGSGLGLAITKKVIQRHGGSIEAFNTDKGLEIRISLPRQP